jgi:hypothetical protein
MYHDFLRSIYAHWIVLVDSEYVFLLLTSNDELSFVDVKTLPQPLIENDTASEYNYDIFRKRISQLATQTTTW